MSYPKDIVLNSLRINGGSDHTAGAQTADLIVKGGVLIKQKLCTDSLDVRNDTRTNRITELTKNTGVTIEGVLIKAGVIYGEVQSINDERSLKNDQINIELLKAEQSKNEYLKENSQREHSLQRDRINAECLIEQTKLEMAKMDLAKLELLSKDSQAKAEAQKSELAIVELLSKIESSKAELAKAELAKAELAKAELAKAELAKAEDPICWYQGQVTISFPDNSIKVDTPVVKNTSLIFLTLVNPAPTGPVVSINQIIENEGFIINSDIAAAPYSEGITVNWFILR